MIDVDGAEAGADVAGEEDCVEDEEGDEEQVEGRLHLRRADAGIGWFLDHFSASFLYLRRLPAVPAYKATRQTAQRTSLSLEKFKELVCTVTIAARPEKLVP